MSLHERALPSQINKCQLNVHSLKDRQLHHNFVKYVPLEITFTTTVIYLTWGTSEGSGNGAFLFTGAP
jgi:hypothetical protein